MHIKDTFPELYKIRRPLKLEEVRERLRDARGKEYWRSLEELAESEEFEELLHREFPRHASEFSDDAGEGTDRRTFIKLMGASLALAGLSGCAYQPPETIVPYVRSPQGEVPGKPLYYATAMPFAGGATGLLVRSNSGRPTKVEGNPDHPASLGATDLFAQASVLSLYDPDRSTTLNYRGEIRSYTSFLADLNRALEAQRDRGGAGLRFLTETVISPTVGAQLREIGARFPGATWHQFEPAGAGGASSGARQAFGAPVNTIYNFVAADRVLSLDSDFLSCGPASLRYARDFANRRRLADGGTEMNRLYAVETTPTNTGVFADHRLSIKPSEMETFARALASSLGVSTSGGAAATPATATPAPSGAHVEWIAAVAKDLREHAGRSIVIAGDEQSGAVHALAHAMNAALANVGQTVTYTEPIEVNPVDQLQSLRDLVTAIDAGQVDILVIVGGNPVYTTPADLKLDKARLDRVALRIHLSAYQDETSHLCFWHIPESHYLEAWGDTRAFDGTVSIIQPLIQPLYNTKSVNEFLAAFTERPERSGYDIVREYWGAQTQMSGGDFEKAWRYALHDGLIPNTASAPSRNVPGAGAQQSQPNSATATPSDTPATTTATAQTAVVVPPPTQTGNATGGGGLEIVFRPDPTIYDGRYANNGWLQELPKPLTKLTWDNAAIISPATAAKYEFGIPGKQGFERENDFTTKGSELLAEVVELKFNGRTIKAPVWIMPGQPDDVVTLHLGYGRWRAGRTGTSVDEGKPENFRDANFQNAYALRTSDAMWSGSGVEMRKTGETYLLASTQLHFNMEGREIVRGGTLEEYRKDPTLRQHRDEDKQPPKPAGENRKPLEGESLYEGFDYSEGERNSRGHRWGMVIDLTTCTGCTACVVACQAENNIPVVGKEQVARGREMHWLRVDAYFKGLRENPAGVYFMPVPCMHCELAPCEPVCPVHATVHSAEGLNDMVYNRCVGTRYCSNNCPYKVRRFNFLLYQDFNTPSLKMMRNPEVSVRSRGVMEKCTYCVQRIEAAKIEAEKEDRKVRDGEIKTACQAVCPTEAIVFGDLGDPQSRVAKLRGAERNYDLLADLNTRPRTTYLAAVRNPNGEIKT